MQVVKNFFLYIKIASLDFYLYNKKELFLKN